VIDDPGDILTSAVRVVKGKVIVGNSGAEQAVRGQFSAWDAETGKLVWRFYTVPGDPSKPFEQPELAMAAKTWTGEWYKMGGGGTVWDAMAYDPDADILYIGTGNGGPWSHVYRGPGGGDNLFLASVLAVKPETGKMVWYFQETPGDDSVIRYSSSRVGWG
jgi:quinohemoprotein ethanol dehydrogenase